MHLDKSNSNFNLSAKTEDFQSSQLQELDNSQAFFMQRALQLAKLGRFSTKPNPSVGCVLVKDGKIIGEGWHKKAGMPHAEIEAIKNALSAIDFLQNSSQTCESCSENQLSAIQVLEKSKETQLSAIDFLQGATAYVTLEPCSHYGRTPPCALALVNSGFSKVVIGMQDPNPKVAGNGIKILQQAGVEVVSDILETQAEKINASFLHKMRTGKPLVIGKVAMSIDGKTALQNGASKWITGKESRQKVQELRALASCVLTGIDTILADDSRLNVRESELQEFLKTKGEDSLEDLAKIQIEQPLRAVLDSSFRIPLNAKVIGDDGKAIIFVGSDYAKTEEANFLQKKTQLEKLGCKVFVVPISYNKRLNLSEVLKQLGNLECNSILVEAGANLTGAFMQEDLLDEVYIFQAPFVIGDKARSAFNMQEIESLEHKKQFTIESVEKFGTDLCIKLKKS